MTTLSATWPVCGSCCEVAPYSWIGESHRCAGTMRTVHDDERRSVAPQGPIGRRADNFAYCLQRAITGGEYSGHHDMGLDAETLTAIASVADQFPDTSVNVVAAAYEAFARDIRGIHYNESRAVHRACAAGEIAQRERPDRALAPDADGGPRSEYGPDSITVIDPDPTSAREWILANRVNPSELYRRLVLDGQWPRTCEPLTSFVVGCSGFPEGERARDEC